MSSRIRPPFVANPKVPNACDERSRYNNRIPIAIQVNQRIDGGE